MLIGVISVPSNHRNGWSGANGMQLQVEPVRLHELNSKGYHSYPVPFSEFNKPAIQKAHETTWVEVMFNTTLGIPINCITILKEENENFLSLLKKI